MQQLHNESYGHPDSEAHTAQQSVQVKRISEVGALSFGQHLHVMDASRTVQFHDSPMAMGQRIDQITVIVFQHLVEGFPVHVFRYLALLDLRWIERIVKSIDGKNHLVKAQGVVGTIQQAQAQGPGRAVRIVGKGEEDLVAASLPSHIFGNAIAARRDRKSRHQLVDRGSDRHIAPSHSPTDVGQRIVFGQQSVESGLLLGGLARVLLARLHTTASDGSAVDCFAPDHIHGAPQLASGVPGVGLGLGFARELLLKFFHRLGALPLGVQSADITLDHGVLVIIITCGASHAHRCDKPHQ